VARGGIFRARLGVKKDERRGKGFLEFQMQKPARSKGANDCGFGIADCGFDFRQTTNPKSEIQNRKAHLLRACFRNKCRSPHDSRGRVRQQTTTLLRAGALVNKNRPYCVRASAFFNRFIFKMFLKIFKHELRRLWRDYTAGIAALLIFAAALAAAYNGAHAFRAQAAAQANILAEENESFEKMKRDAQAIEAGEKKAPPFGNPLKASSLKLFYPRTAALPPSGFAFASVGQTDVYPSFYKVSGRHREAFVGTQEMENPLNLLIGRFDLAFVVVYLLPLFIFAVSYNLLAGERESGTLRLLLAQGVKVRSLLFGKLAARAVVLLAPLFLAAVLATAFFGGADVWLKFALFAAAVVLYAAFWFGIAALVNLYGSASATNAAALAAIWIALVLIVPTLVHLTATAARPVPSRLELIAASRDAQVRARRPVELLENYYAKHPERRPAGKDLRVYDFPFYYAAIQREIDRQIAPEVERYDRALEAQQDFVQTAGVLSPALLAQEIFNDLAGTGFNRYQAFYRQTLEFYNAHVEFYEAKSFSDTPLQSADYDRMPRFAFREETTGELAARRLAIFAAHDFNRRRRFSNLA
jgi:ABC-2 type transport system permease protein